MHKVTIGDDIKSRLVARRGRYHLYDEIEARKSALIIIDMQNAFCAPGAPAEVASSRGIVSNINNFTATLRDTAVEIIWVVSAFDSVGSGTDWENFFNYIVADEVRDKTRAYMAPGAEGTRLWPELNRQSDEQLIVKNRYSCFVPGASHLERVLRSRNIETLLLAGTKTNICCETAARAAFDMDFKVVMVEDCCAALSDREHLAALENVIQQFGDVMTCAEILERLC
ncbi:MAG: isochorismatase family cysteine hydrolase [Pseudomonadota bacterium]